MGLPRDQRVCDLLFRIADLVQEADHYLSESSLFKSSVPKPRKPRKRTLKDTGPGEFLSPGGIEPNKADRVTNRLRNTQERLDKPARDVLRARRDRKERSRYQASKLTGKPEKRLGSRFRLR